MKSTGQKLILISFIFALLAAIIIFVYLQSLNSPKQGDKKINVLVANETIPARTIIDKKMIKEIQVADNPIFDDYIKDSSKITGKFTKETIFKNDGFKTDNLLDKNSNELCTRINDNYRAISISVTGESGVSDLLKPDDYVDVIVYLSEKKDGTKTVRPDIAKIILQNIEVLAVDKTINRDENTDNSNSTTAASNASPNFLVTLAVQKADTEKLVLAESIGTIKLDLRSLSDKDVIQTKGAVFNSLLNNSSSNVKNASVEKKVVTKTNISKTQKYINYTVKPKDSLRKISRKFYGDPNKYKIIKQANNIKNEDVIEKKQVIKIPILKK